MMTPVELIRDAMSKNLTEPSDGDPVDLDPQPALSDSQIDEFERTLPCKLPTNIRELLSFCSGFYCSYEVEFTALAGSLGLEEIFPHCHPIMSDGCGNFWVVDLTPSSAHWGPIYFACHDPAMILFQAASIEEFLSELFRLHEPPHSSLIWDVAEFDFLKISTQHPGEIEFREAITSDSVLKSFAETLGEEWTYIDLRNSSPGMGFDWARFGLRTGVKRFGYEPIFAYRPGPRKPGLLSMLFGKKG